MRIYLTLIAICISSSAIAQEQGQADFTPIGIIRPGYDWIKERPRDRNVVVLLDNVSGEILTCGLQTGFCRRTKIPGN